MRRLSNPLYFLDQTFNYTKLGKQYAKDVEVLHEFTRAVSIPKINIKETPDDVDTEIPIKNCFFSFKV